MSLPCVLYFLRRAARLDSERRHPTHPKDDVFFAADFVSIIKYHGAVTPTRGYKADE